MKTKEGYDLIPMSEITEEAREIAVAWMECEDKDWIGQKHKLASDIMNYAKKHGYTPVLPSDETIENASKELSIKTKGINFEKEVNDLSLEMLQTGFIIGAKFCRDGKMLASNLSVQTDRSQLSPSKGKEPDDRPEKEVSAEKFAKIKHHDRITVFKILILHSRTKEDNRRGERKNT